MGVGEQCSFWLDSFLVFLTVLKIIRRKGEFEFIQRVVSSLQSEIRSEQELQCIRLELFYSHTKFNFNSLETFIFPRIKEY